MRNLVMLAVMVVVSGCASGGGGRVALDGLRAPAMPGALFESNVPFAERCGSGQVLVCESDAGGHDCGCVQHNLLEQQIGGFSGDTRRSSMR